MEREQLVLLIAECLMESAYPDDVVKQADNIVMRIERWERINKSDAAIETLNDKEKRKAITVLNAGEERKRIDLEDALKAARTPL